MKRCRLCDVKLSRKVRVGKRTECRLCMNSRRRIYHRKHKKRENQNAIKRHYVRVYGLTAAEKRRRLAKQKGCAICKRRRCGSRDWHLDHDHKKKINRGVLCRSCNLMIGHAHDNIRILKAAVKYLLKWKKKQPA